MWSNTPSVLQGSKSQVLLSYGNLGSHVPLTYTRSTPHPQAIRSTTAPVPRETQIPRATNLHRLKNDGATTLLTLQDAWRPPSPQSFRKLESDVSLPYASFKSHVLFPYSNPDPGVPLGYARRPDGSKTRRATILQGPESPQKAPKPP